MTERPIIFSAPMVRAILDGRKTQTRRMVKTCKQFDEWNSSPGMAYHVEASEIAGAFHFLVAGDHGYTDAVPCPFGQPGDRLWLRETYYAWGRWETRFDPKKGRDAWRFVDMTAECGHEYRYAADYADYNAPIQPSSCRTSYLVGWWKRPAIFMPRAASRISLEVESVRVERLQDITEADAQAEGCLPDVVGGFVICGTRKTTFRKLWKSINDAESWDANPFVWVVGFRRLER